jgi:hypothetical protein
MATLKRMNPSIAVLVLLLAVAAPALARTPRQQVASLRRQLAAARHLNTRLKAQNAKVDGLYRAEQNLYSQAQATTETQAAGGAAAIIAAGPDAMWAAVSAIWQAFPTFGLDSHCGYTKTGSTSVGPGPVTNYLDFQHVTNCSG